MFWKFVNIVLIKVKQFFALYAKFFNLYLAKHAH